MKTTRAANLLSLVALVAALFTVGCASEEQRRVAGPPKHTATTCVDDDGDGAGEGCAMPDCDDTDPSVAALCDDGQNPVDSCNEGETRACKVDLGENNGVKSCFEGVQSCHEGVWGECGGQA